MKFPKFQHERILKIIQDNGYALEDFYFVKRKGWIRIEHTLSDTFFTYFKMKETRITKKGEWEFGVHFKVKTTAGRLDDEPTFDSLMDLFKKWVSELN